MRMENKVDRSIHIAKVIKPRALACLGVFSEVRRTIWRRASEWTEEAGLIAEGQWLRKRHIKICFLNEWACCALDDIA